MTANGIDTLAMGKRAARAALALVVALVAGGLTATASATYVEVDTLRAQFTESDLIFEGVVVDRWSELYDAEHAVFITQVLMTVVTTYKGSVSSGMVTVTIPGGCHPDGSQTSVPATPTLELGDELLLHAVALSNSSVRLANWSTGYLRFATNASGQPVTLDGQGRLVAQIGLDQKPIFASLDYALLVPAPEVYRCSGGIDNPVARTIEGDSPALWVEDASALTPDAARAAVTAATSAMSTVGRPAAALPGYTEAP